MTAGDNCQKRITDPFTGQIIGHAFHWALDQVARVCPIRESTTPSGRRFTREDKVYLFVQVNYMLNYINY